MIRYPQNININKQKNNKTKDAKIKQNKEKNYKNTSKFYGAHSLLYFHTWSAFGRNFWKVLGDVGLLEEVCLC